MSNPDPAIPQATESKVPAKAGPFANLRWAQAMWTCLAMSAVEFAPYRGIKANSPDYWVKTPAFTPDQIKYGTMVEDFMMGLFAIALLIAFVFLTQKPRRLQGILGLLAAGLMLFLQIRFSNIFLFR
jgi:hypothetical protein